jgi:pyruvate/2-oxoglutarate/acetoin dehydrogenase E1 component
MFASGMAGDAMATSAMAQLVQQRDNLYIPEVTKAILKHQTYKEALHRQMCLFSEDHRSRFVGYGLLNGRGANGTMKGIPNEKIIETTVAENLMIGIAHGLALTGLHPMVYVERADFLACGLSAISNHLDKAKEISRGVFNPCVIIRVLVGNKTKPLFTGPTHTSDPSEAMKAMLKMPVYRVRTPDEVTAAYGRAAYEQRQGIGSSMVFEYRDLFNL